MFKEYSFPLALAVMTLLAASIVGCSPQTPDLGDICYLCDTSFSFSLQTSSATHTIEQGDVATTSIWMKKTSGNYSHDISLSVRNCPAQVRCVLSTSIINELNGTNLSLYTTASTPTGTWNIIIDGADTGSSGAKASSSINLSVVQSTLQLNYTKTTNAVGAEPVSIAAADFNGDNAPDLAVVNSGSNEVTVLYGDGLGAFPTRTQLYTGARPVSVVANDFNADGATDIVVANADDETLSVFWGNGAGSFLTKTDINVGVPGGVCESVVAGDFNGDGVPDLASLNHISGTDVVSVLINDGTGNFGYVNNLDAGIYPSGLTLGDFNNDGNLDIAFVDLGYTSNNAKVLYGNGSGAFGPLSTLQLLPNSGGIAAGDLNGDNKTDVVVNNRSTLIQSAYLNDGTGVFHINLNSQVFINPVSMLLQDMNSDSYLDMVGVNASLDSITVRTGDGFGGFSKLKSFAVGKGPSALVIGDFNGDGKKDVATANTGDNTVTVLLEQ